MRAIRITIGGLLVLGSAMMLFLILAFSSLATSGPEDHSSEHRPTTLGVMFRTPETFISMAVMMGGVGLCLYRPGMAMKMTVARLMAMTGILAILLGLFLRAAKRESMQSEGRSANPNGTSHVVREYRNWYGPTRTVETDEP